MLIIIYHLCSLYIERAYENYVSIIFWPETSPISLQKLMGNRGVLAMIIHSSGEIFN